MTAWQADSSMSMLVRAIHQGYTRFWGHMTTIALAPVPRNGGSSLLVEAEGGDGGGGDAEDEVLVVVPEAGPGLAVLHGVVDHRAHVGAAFLRCQLAGG